MSAYYNENDPKEAAVLRRLIKEGHIADGDVDERSIEDVTPNELLAYTQVHLFAGYGLWSLAFRWAGIGDDEPAWSCSCPCQPFSAAGKGEGFADERHLWPAAFHLIANAKRRDVPIYGEQVASSRVMPWIDLVWSDLEATGHAFRPFVLASAGFGAPIIRQRTFWVASAECDGRQEGRDGKARLEGGPTLSEHGSEFEWVASATHGDRGRGERGEEAGVGQNGERWRRPASGGLAGGLVRSFQSRLEGHGGDGDAGPGEQALGLGDTAGDRCGTLDGQSGPSIRQEVEDRGPGILGGLAGTNGGESSNGRIQRGGEHGLREKDASTGDGDQRPGPTNGFWSHADWLRCRDELWRPVEPGTFPLAHGYPERMGLLRGFGNAISPQVAAEFIKAHREAERQIA